MIDSHCHLTDKQFTSDLADVLLRAEEHGVDTMVCIADRLEEAEQVRELAETHTNIFATAGVHPHHAKHWQAGDDKRLAALLESTHKMVAVGEIGLDYHYDNSPRDTQQHVFRTQLELAKKLEYPVVIHNRDSFDDLWRIVTEVNPTSAVLHCCTEPWDHVERWIEAGYWLSFTGIATYPKSEEIRDTITRCPLEQLMVETDAPYLAPVPHRGKRNEPAFVVEVARLVAELKGLSLEEVDSITTANAVQFFGLVE